MIQPILIDRDAIFDDGSLHQAFGLTPATLARARRSGALRHTRQGKRTLYKGEWVLDWLEADENTSRRRPDQERRTL
jgi:hypothetical protein